MPDGTIFVAAGSINGLDYYIASNNNPTYEILDRNGVSSGVSIPMSILVRNQPYYMYPFLHLLRDGSLFIFVAKQAQLFDVAAGQVIKDLPDLPGFYRTYPNTGGSVSLPMSRADNFEPHVMICGGGAKQTGDSASDDSCGMIKPLAPNSKWTFTAMPEHRVMVEGVNLLDGTVLWLNGAQLGAQGFGIADAPTYDALIYDPRTEIWAKAGTSTIARLYHSVALLLADGSVLVSGSNPNEMPLHDYELDASVLIKKFPTEFRNEIWTPPYLQGDKAKHRPIEIILSKSTLRPGETFTIKFRMPPPGLLGKLDIILHTNGFVTHSVHMGQVMYTMEPTGWTSNGGGVFEAEAKVPGVKLAPGPYFVYLMANGVPGVGKAVMIAC